MDHGSKAMRRGDTVEKKNRIHLAIDIGASSGRHIAAWRQDRELVITEVYRFSNLPKRENGHLIWDIDMLRRETINGLKACREKGIVPDSVGIDTWAVDYVLLDKENEPIEPVYCYRDHRGAEAAERVHEIIPFPTLYSKTGIQYQSFNTIYQLYSDKLSGRLDRAEDFLMLPEYLSFYISGVKRREYTNASSTGLLRAGLPQWDDEIINTLELPRRLFSAQPTVPPVILGRLRNDIAAVAGFNCDVVLPATHDTASAVAAMPKNGAYISSGTWSLLGAQLDTPLTSRQAMEANFTNEGGVGTVRFLKNIMGLWLIQCVKRELDDKYSFSMLADMAEKEADFDYALDVNAPRYMAPDSVISEIKNDCLQRGLPVPETPGQLAHAVYCSLAHAYAAALDELENITGRRFDTVCIAGGGANNKYLNRLTQRFSGRRVVTGPSEATATGNIIMQEAAYV